MSKRKNIILLPDNTFGEYNNNIKKNYTFSPQFIDKKYKVNSVMYIPNDYALLTKHIRNIDFINTFFSKEGFVKFTKRMDETYGFYLKNKIKMEDLKKTDNSEEKEKFEIQNKKFIKTNII